MSVDLNRLTAHLSAQQQEEVRKAYHRQAEHSTAAFLYCFFLGIFGAHRFYLRQWGKGLAHLVLPVLAAAAIVAGIALKWDPAVIALIVIPLLVIALIWEIVNLFTIDAEVYQHNLKLAEQLVAQSLLADTTVERRAEAKLDTMLAASQVASAAAAEQSRVTSDTAAEAAAPAPDMVPVAPTAAVEGVSASEVRDAAAAMSVGQYVETSVTQISDEGGARQGEAAEAAETKTQEPTSWSETERIGDSQTAVTSDPAEAAEEMTVAGGMGAIAAEENQSAEAENASYWEAVTRTHEQTGYTVTDSVERTDTYGFGEAQDTTEGVVAEAEPLPTAAEAAAATWPDHLLMDVTDGGTVFQAAHVEVRDAASFPAPRPAPSRDVTDMGAVVGEPKPVADVATEGGVPLSVALPGSGVLVGVEEIVAAMPATPEAPAAAAAEESVLVLVPDESEAQGAGIGDYAATDAGTADMSDTAPAIEAVTSAPASDAGGYERPTQAPYVAEAAAAAALVTGYAALSSDTPTLVPEQQQSVAAPAEQPEGETLAELAGFGAGAAVEHTEPTTLAAAAGTEPARETEPGADAEYHATHTAEGEPGHHRMRRIRVVRQVKVEGQVVEETTAEEFIEADADPEPVRQRLQEMLRQQAAGRQPSNLGGGDVSQ